MSGSTNLGINITARDAASAEIKGLQATVRGLAQTLQQLSSLGASANAASAASIKRETDAIRQKIGALEQEIAAKSASSAAGIRASQQEADYINRNIDLVDKKAQATIRAANTSSRAQIQASNEAARYEAEDIARVMAAREAAVRVALKANNDRVFKERAAEDVAAAARARASLGQGLTLTPASGFSKEAAELAGVKSSMLSAAESAAVFQRELGAVGGGVIVANTQKTINTIQGIGRELLSAKESAIVFERELGAIGGGLTLTPASGFSKMVGELAGVKSSYLSAAASARVFEEAGVSAAEHIAVAEAASSRAGGGGASSLFQRESRHIVGEFDSLMRGQKGQAISSLGAGLRDAGLSAGMLGASIGGLVAVMGSEALLRGAENMGRWATETRAAASAAGMGIGPYSSLQGALTLTGLKADEADTVLKRLAINLGEAIAQPTSLAAQAFHNLGISQDDLVKTGGDTEAALRLLATAFTTTADGANKSANMNEIFGRGFEKIIPLLQNGTTSMDELRAKAQALGLTLTDETAKGLEKTGEEATSLGASIKGSAIKSFEEWQPVIRATIEILKELVAEIGLVVGGFGQIASGVLKLAQGALSNPFESYPDYVKRMMALAHPSAGGSGAMDRHDDTGNKTSVPALIHGSGGAETVMEKMRHDAAQASMEASKGAKTRQAAAQAEGNAEIAVMQKTLATATLTAQQRAQIETELYNKTTSMRNSALSASSAAASKAAKQDYADFAATEKLKVAEADKSASQIAAVYDEWLTAAEGRYKQHASVIASIEREKVQAVNAARLEEIKEGAQQSEQNNRLSGLNSTLSQMQKGQYNFGGSSQTPAMLQKQSSQALAEAAQVKAAADTEIAALIQVRDTAEQGSATQKQASAEIMSVLIQSKSQEIELYKKAGEAAQQAADKAAEGFKKFFDSVGSGFETFTGSVLKSLIAPQQEIIKAGLTSITKNMRGSEIQQAFGQLANHVLSSLGSSIEEAIGSTIAKALSGGVANSIGELLSQTFSKILGNITGGAIGSVAGTAVGGAAGNAAVSAAITASATATTTGISTAITAAAATQTAAVTTGSASIVAAITAAASTEDALLAATAVKPSALGFSYAGGGVVPSAAGGMVLGDSRGGQLAILHPREMVLPAHLSKGIQGMINGQGGQQAGGASQTNNLNVSSTFNSSRSRGGTGMSRAEFSQAMSLHSGAMLGEARNMMRAGWRPA